MKPRNREISIFNLSMLDVISGAVGAFLIITVVLFPSYGRNIKIGEARRIELEKVKQKLLARLETLKSQPRVDPEEIRRKNERLKDRLAKSQSRSTSSERLDPLLIVGAAGSLTDVQPVALPELPNVTPFDPASEHDWQDPSYYASEVKLPGQPLHFLLIPQPLPGVSYRIYLRIRNVARQVRRFGSAGRFIYKGKSYELPTFWFEAPKKGTGAFIGTIKFDQQGEMRFVSATEEMQKDFDSRNGLR